MFRLFVAVALPEPIRARLAMLQYGVPGARWVQPENLHLSLRFLGEVDGGVAQDVDGALGRVRAPAFTLNLDGVDQFGDRRTARVLWAGVVRTESLQQLHDKVDRAAVAAGLPPDDRKFRPHVTLARLKEMRPKAAALPRVQQWLAHNNLFAAGPIAVDRFVLYRSHLGQEGARYEALAEYPLTALPPADRGG